MKRPDVGADELHVEVAVGDRHVELVEHAPAEGVERAGEGDVALLREAGGHADQVLLGDAGLDQLGRVEVLEDVQAGGAAQVRVERHDLRVLVRRGRPARSPSGSASPWSSSGPGRVNWAIARAPTAAGR